MILPDDVPANAGTYAPPRGHGARGQHRQRRLPLGRGGRHVETSQRIADTVLLALAQATDVSAQGQGSMSALVIGGTGWTYVETLGGGQGASSRGPSPSGVHVGMTNTLNTPVEALELEYPLRAERYELARGSSGAGPIRKPKTCSTSSSSARSSYSKSKSTGSPRSTRTAPPSPCRR